MKDSDAGRNIRERFANVGVDPANVFDLGGPFPSYATLLRVAPQRMTRAFPDEYELFVPTRPVELTELTGRYAGRKFAYRNGMVAFNPPGYTWTIEWHGTLEGVSLIVTSEVMRLAVGELFDEDPDHIVWRQVFCDYAPAIAYLSLDLVSQASIGYPAGDKHFAHVLNSMFSLMIRRYAKTPERDTSSVGIMSRVVLSAMQYVERNLGQKMSVEQISEAVASSAPQLNRHFRSELNTSVWAYVRQRRLATAAQMLAATGSPVSMISRQVGYGNRSNFSKAFAVQYGSPPTDYRLKLAKQHPVRDER